MQKLIVFNNISLDGYFTAANGDFSWAKVDTDDAEFTAFVEGNASGDGQLLFGRITYQMMASFWPTPHAIKTFPKVGRGHEQHAESRILVKHPTTRHGITLGSQKAISRPR